MRRHACALLVIAVVGCGGSETPPPGTVSGPLCELLPSGDDPGAPARALVEQHVARGALALAEMIEAGELTTLAGDTLEVARQDAMARLGGRATTVCADYAAAGARIHVIDAVLSR